MEGSLKRVVFLTVYFISQMNKNVKRDSIGGITELFRPGFSKT